MLNRSILMGRLTADPEYRQTPNGIAVCSFSLAVNRNYNREITDFINIVVWRQTADFVNKYFRKGQLVAVEGSIQTRNYEDKNGNKRSAVEIVADQVYFAESKNSSSSNNSYSSNVSESNQSHSSSPENFSIGDFDDFEEFSGASEDLPF